MEKNSDFYRIIYYCDEIGIKPTSCLQPWNCNCDTQTVRCGYSVEESKNKIIKHYEERLNYLKNLSNEDFLRDMGIYYD